MSLRSKPPAVRAFDNVRLRRRQRARPAGRARPSFLSQRTHILMC